jgi:trehalose 6-phosphate phosphatase
MRDVLARSNVAILRRFARSHVVVVFDFDGTLSPIVGDPRAAALRPRTHTLLRRLAGVVPCAVLSGRPRADVARRLRGIALREIVGNHGLGIATPDVAARASRQVRRWLRVLGAALASLDGVVVEDNRLSVAVHYRHAARPLQARRVVMEVVGRLGPLRVVGGKRVVNLLPVGGPDKGTALAAIRTRVGCDTAIYVGDDETDEDVFRAADPACVLGIRVGRSARSSARYFIDGQRRIDDLISILTAARTGGTRAGR